MQTSEAFNNQPWSHSHVDDISVENLNQTTTNIMVGEINTKTIDYKFRIQSLSEKSKKDMI